MCCIALQGASGSDVDPSVHTALKELADIILSKVRGTVV